MEKLEFDFNYKANKEKKPFQILIPKEFTIKCAKNYFYDIKGYEGLYKINLYGEVWSFRNKKIIKHLKSPDGAWVYLWKDKEPTMFYIDELLANLYCEIAHRLSAEFINRDEA